MLTDAVTRFGHALVSGLFRFDPNKLVPRAVETQISASLFDWSRLSIANVERLIAWLILWPAAHISMVLISLAAGLKQEPKFVVVPVELIPGLMLSWSLLRASYTLRTARHVSEALESARQGQLQPPSWATEHDWRYRLMEGGDWEIAGAAALAVLLVLL